MTYLTFFKFYFLKMKGYITDKEKPLENSPTRITAVYKKFKKIGSVLIP